MPNTDTILGVIGLLTIPPAFGALIYNLLPSTRLPDLEQIFSETEGLLQKNTEAGLLGSHDVALGFRSRLELLRTRLEEVQVESHCATTLLQNVKKMLGGLSRCIFYLSNDVKELRADISTTSARERERLRQCQASLARGGETSSTPSSISPAGSSSSAPPTVAVAPSEGDAYDGKAGAGDVHDACTTTSPSTASSSTTTHPPITSSCYPESIVDCPDSSPECASPALSALHSLSSNTTATPVAEQAGPTAPPSQHPEGSPHASCYRHKRSGYSPSRMRVFARIMRGKPNRAPSSSGSARGLMLVPSRTLASIEAVSDGDDAEWEDLAVCHVLPV
ncbi:hypothetical protein FKP32DRAFT_291150 [Trametes sanguinea]|nr:hypothetical protein FKP32DRAFT_291150 [Trametes sanguinea]